MTEQASDERLRVETLIKRCLDEEPPVVQIAVVEDSLALDRLVIKVHGPADEFGQSLSVSDDLTEVVIDGVVYRAEIVEDPYGPQTLNRIPLYGPGQETESVSTEEAISTLAERLTQANEIPAQLDHT